MKPCNFVKTGSIVEMGGYSCRNSLQAKKKNTSQNSKIVNRGGRSYKGQTISLVIYPRSFQFFSCFKYVGGNSLSINFCICKVKKMFASSKSGGGGREGETAPCLTISPPPLPVVFL